MQQKQQPVGNQVAPLVRARASGVPLQQTKMATQLPLPSGLALLPRETEAQHILDSQYQSRGAKALKMLEVVRKIIEPLGGVFALVSMPDRRQALYLHLEVSTKAKSIDPDLAENARVAGLELHLLLRPSGPRAYVLTIMESGPAEDPARITQTSLTILRLLGYDPDTGRRSGAIQTHTILLSPGHFDLEFDDAECVSGVRSRKDLR